MRRTILLPAAALLAGFAAGAYLFSDTQRRPAMSFQSCGRGCFNSKQVLGLLGSVGMTKLPDLIPSAVLETDKTLVVRHPFPKSRVHYVAIPKKDIKDLGDLSAGDEEYLADIFAVLQELVRREGLTRYQVITNGPEKQDVAYIHFHLTAR